MENKKDMKGILLIAFAIISLSLGGFIIYDKVLKKESFNCPKNDCQCEKCRECENSETLDIVSVSYSHGGGYGIEFYTIITITENEIKFSNKYNDYVETYDMEKGKFYELVAYINNNISIFNNGVKENNAVTDGSSSNITIILKNGEERKVGGYMVEDEKYSGIVNKIFEMIDGDKFTEYRKNIDKH